MTRRTPSRLLPTLRIAVPLLAIVGAVAVFAWRSLAGPPVLVRAGEGPQSCLMCVGHARPTEFQLRAEQVSRTYRLTREATVLVRFDEGSVTLGGEPLEPGCHLVWGSEGSRLAFAGARGVWLRWPVPAGGCGG